MRQWPLAVGTKFGVYFLIGWNLSVLSKIAGGAWLLTGVVYIAAAARLSRGADDRFQWVMKQMQRRKPVESVLQR